MLKITLESSDGAFIDAAAKELAARHYAIVLQATVAQAATPASGGRGPTQRLSLTATLTGRFGTSDVDETTTLCARYLRHGNVTCSNSATYSSP